MRVLIGAAVSSALLLGGAAQADGPPAQAGPEHLVMAPYPGPPWKQIGQNGGVGDGLSHESIPADQSSPNYTDVLSDQSSPWLPGATNHDPAKFIKVTYGTLYPAICDNERMTGPFAMKEGGFDVAYAQAYCGRQRNRSYGLVAFYKVIAGDRAIYMVTRQFRVPVSSSGPDRSVTRQDAAKAAALAKAESVGDQYLADQVYLCGGRSTDERCGK